MMVRIRPAPLRDGYEAGAVSAIGKSSAMRRCPQAAVPASVQSIQQIASIS